MKAKYLTAVMGYYGFGVFAGVVGANHNYGIAVLMTISIIIGTGIGIFLTRNSPVWRE
jgi:hypothetical protein